MTQGNRFTPGPWRVFGRMTGKVISENAPGIVEICETGDFRDAELVPFNAERWNADAHLIAAAPDMLEALHLALPYVRNDNTASAIRAAIARAVPAPAETRVQCYRGEYYKRKEHGTCIKRDGEVLWDTWEPEA